MPKTITQNILFKNTSPAVLYELYVDSKKHTMSTGATAKISNKAGGKFSAYNGYCFGKNLLLIKNKLIMQTWRATDWTKSDEDSVFMILLQRKGKDTLLEFIHANLPDKQADSLKKGWTEFYWKPWKKFLAKNGKR